MLTFDLRLSGAAALRRAYARRVLIRSGGPSWIQWPRAFSGTANVKSSGNGKGEVSQNSYIWKSESDYALLRAASVSNPKRSKKAAMDLYTASFRPPMTLADKEVEHDLQQGTRPIDVLRSCISHGTASAHAVRLCLEAQWSAQESIPRNQRFKLREVQRSEGFARTVISHILQDLSNWVQFIHREKQAIDTLCYFAVIEDLEEVVLKWLELSTPGRGQDQYWRSSLFSSVCKAHDILDTRACADRSLETFLQVIATIASQRAELNAQRGRTEDKNRPGILWLNPRPALVMLVGKMYAPMDLFGKYRTDAALFDQFISYYKKFESGNRKKEPHELAWDMSRLHLEHPRMQDMGPALETLTNYHKHGPDVIASPSTWSSKALQMPMARFIRRTAEVAEASGNMDAAVWIFKTFEKEFLMVKPLSWARANAQIKSLGVPPTPVQQRLLAAATRSGGLREKPRPETVQAQIKLSPAEHAQKFQSFIT